MSGENSNSRRQRGLGKGLAVLLGEVPEIPNAQKKEHGYKLLPIQDIVTCKSQPRKNFDLQELESLAKSIKTQGIVLPLIVRSKSPEEENEVYEIIAGERRWRAAQIAGLHEVPVIIRQLDDKAAMEVALVENLQRENLDPLEESAAYERLVKEYGNTHDEIGASVGKSRSYVANTLRLMGLTDSIKTLLVNGKITVGHARALLGVENPDQLADIIVRRKLNVRQTEALVQKEKKKTNGKYHNRKTWKDPNIASIEKDITNKYGLKVRISSKGESGSVVFEYKSLEQLEELLKILM
ncbi:MAG: chromosome partitioning protein ParB [Gammaproteobacteria bacterium]|nr:chromosome partitioning protein ParB [Gammaproteobacteria bacterium]